MQSYGQWVAGHQVGPALPRDLKDFLAGAFGPLEPLVPWPIDEPTDSGRPTPRRWQYPVGWNLPVGVPGTEGLKLASFQALRRYADIYSVLRAALNVRIGEMCGLEWDIGPTGDAETAARGNKVLQKDLKDRANKAKQFWKRPDPNYYDFQQWFRASLEDKFVIDAMSFYLHPTRIDGKGPFGSSLASVELIDGSTIRPLLDIHGATPRPPEPAYQQFLWGVPRTELMEMMSGLDLAVLEEDGIKNPDQEYVGDQLLYMVSNRRSHTPYGFSAVEQAILPLTIGLKRQEFLLDYYTEGTIPGVYVVAGDQYVTPAMQRQLQDTLNAIAGDIAYKHRVIVLPPGSKTDPQKDFAWQQQIDQTILEYVGMILHVQPHELGAVPGGRTSGLGGSGMVQAQQHSVDQTRTLGDKAFLKSTLFDYVIQQQWGQYDLEWKWVEDEKASDKQAEAETQKTFLLSGQTTIDELRIERGQDPFQLALTSTPWVQGGPQGILPLDPEAAKALQAMQPPPPAPPTIGPDGKPIPGTGGPQQGPPGAPGKPPFGKPGGTPGAAPPQKPAGVPQKANPPKPGDVAPGSSGAAGKAPKPVKKSKLKKLEKDFSLSAPLSTGLVPFDLPPGSSQTTWTCPECGAQGQWHTHDGGPHDPDVKKTDFYTDDTGVHPVRDSEGYDESVAQAAAIPGVKHLTYAELRSTVSTIRRNAKQADAHLELLRGSRYDPPKSEVMGKVSDLEMALGQGPAGFGMDFTKSALSMQNTLVLTNEHGDVIGAQGYQTDTAGGVRKDFLGTALVYGNGIMGTTGIQPGAGSAVAYAFIKQAAEAKAGIQIHPVFTAREFWSKMGMRPIPSGDGWGMSAADAQRIARQVGQVFKAEDPQEDPEYEAPPDWPPDDGTEQWDPDAAPLADPYEEWRKNRPADKITVASLVKGRVSYKDSKLPEIVHDYLLRSYPPKDVEWVLDPKGSWAYEPHVDLHEINMARRPGGRDPDKVEAIGETLDNGASMDPIVLVERKDQSEYKYDIADGYHRTLGADKAGFHDVKAFVGSGFEKYDDVIQGQMQDDSDSKKAALAELSSLRRYLRHGRGISGFTAKALSLTELERISADIPAMGRSAALAAARRRIDPPLDPNELLKVVEEELARRGVLPKYSEDQARDEHGRWTSESSGRSPDLPAGRIQYNEWQANVHPSNAPGVSHTFERGMDNQWRYSHSTDATGRRFNDHQLSHPFRHGMYQLPVDMRAEDELNYGYQRAGFKYSDDQPRDDHGRWTAGGGGGTSADGHFWSAARLRQPDGSRTDTMGLYKKGGRWDPERVKDIHQPIIDHAREGVRKPDGPPVLYMSGGGFGSGKSTMIASDAAAFPAKGDAVISDPDAIKQSLPEYTQLVAERDPATVSLVHEESSDISKEIVTGSLQDGYNVVYDTSGDSGAAKLEAKVAGFREAGASKVFADYAFPGSVEEAQRRADARAAASGGMRRYVPHDVLAANHHDVSATWQQVARDGTFDRLRLWSTDHPFGTPPTLIAEAVGGRITIHDQPAYDAFTAIGR